MAKRAVNLSTGDHLVDVKCPGCGETTTISVSLTPEYKCRPGVSSLRVVLSQEKSDHNCGQPQLVRPGWGAARAGRRRVGRRVTIVRRNAGLNHYYVDVLDDGTEVKIPRVTGLLSDGIPKGGLTSWAAELAAQYAIEHWDELSELKLLERAKRMQFAWKEERDAAAGRGAQIHALAEKLLHGEKVGVPPGLEGHVEACVAFLDQCSVEPVLTETALQLAAYARGEHYLDAGKVEQPLADVGIQRAAVVHLRADGFDVHPMTITDPVFALFRHVAYVARWVKWDKDTRQAPIDRYKGRALQPAAAAS
jgi:hypothetical protein